MIVNRWKAGSIREFAHLERGNYPVHVGAQFYKPHGQQDLGDTRDPLPDATTVLNFRHWLEEHDLTRALFDEVGAMLEERGPVDAQGTIVDATIIAAPPSTKNEKKARSRGY